MKFTQTVFVGSCFLFCVCLSRESGSVCKFLACMGINQSEAASDNQQPIMWLSSGALDNIDGSVLSE